MALQRAYLATMFMRELANFDTTPINAINILRACSADCWMDPGPVVSELSLSDQTHLGHRQEWSACHRHSWEWLLNFYPARSHKMAFDANSV